MIDQRQRPQEKLGPYLADHISLERHVGPEIAMPKEKLLTNVNNLDKQPVKYFKGKNDDITFSDSDARHVHHPHYDTLVITAMVANNNVHRILMDNRS